MDAEVAANAKLFRDGLATKIDGNIKKISATNANKLSESYEQLTTLQAWRTHVIESKILPGPLGFFSEAQNDGLTSLLLVNCGLWRSSLKSLRSLIENVLHCLYYQDHPVEYRHWELGKDRPTFKFLFDYFEKHPDFIGLPSSLTSCVSQLKSSYSHLSNAVHSSAVELRMTDDLNQTNLWKVTNASVGIWSSSYKNVLRAVNLLLLLLLRDSLQGAANLELRRSLACVIPAAKDATIRSSTKVRIVR